MARTNKTSVFKTRARIVDLLGREQIADAGAAATELLKNAIDAQARHAVVHYHTQERLLEFSDDGLGMRPEDLLDRWLVIATDSRRGPPDSDWLQFADTDQKKRANERPFGEKGIGRLAVASLGNGVLIWTRWGKGQKASRCLALIHWHFFRFPKLNLEDILIPYVLLQPDDDPQEYTRLLLEDMQTWFRTEHKNWAIDEQSRHLAGEIQTDLSKIFPEAVASISNLHQSMGTLFAILGTTEEVGEIFAGQAEAKKGDDTIPSEGLRTFFAFCDPFRTDAKRLNLDLLVDGKTAYADEQNFWQPDDFQKADHVIDLQIDEKGYASGRIKRYDKTQKYEFQTSDLGPRRHYPGPFAIKLGYVPGKKSDSMLDPDGFRVFTERLNSFGALYVYRNGIRVMPYGRTDADFLNFEERRSRNAGRYFFSYRRMFGAIYIDQKKNPGLIDKAGREGFIKNASYRGLVTICVAIFTDLATKHYGSEAHVQEAGRRIKVSATEKETQEATKQFVADLNTARVELARAEKRFRSEIEALNKSIAACTNGAYDAIERAESDFEKLAAQLETQLDNLPAEIPDLAKPTTKNLAAWESYRSTRDDFESTYAREITKSSVKLASIVKRHNKRIERIKKLERRLNNNEKSLQTILTTKRDELISHAHELATKKAEAWFEKQVEALRKIPRETLGANPAEAAVDGGDSALASFEQALSQQRKLIRDEYEPYWAGILREIARIANARSLERAFGELVREKEMLIEREGIYAELAQIGLIVEGIDHEYRVMFNEAKRDFTFLKKAQMETGSRERLFHLEETFLAIDERLRFLAPLFRAERMAYSTVTGSDIRTFVESRQLRQSNSDITVEYTKNFLELSWGAAPRSALYGAILNVINNAIYWVQKSSGPHRIRFSIDPLGFIISDSGKGVAARDSARIFEPFFSRKAHGRGLGLYLSRTALRGHGLDLQLLEGSARGTLTGACFLFTQSKLESDEVDDDA